MGVRSRLLLLPFAGALAACGAIWGFEDGTARDSDAAVTDDDVVPAQGATGVVCVPQPPAEWRGPLVIDEKTGTPPALDPCPAPYGDPFDAFADLDAPAAACNCACGTPNAACAPPVLTVYDDSDDCAGNTPCNTTKPLGACPATDSYPPAGCNAEDTFAKVTTPAAVLPGATCAVRSDPVPPAAWRAGVRLCAPPSAVAGTCPPNKVATPVAPVRYAVNYCIATSGVVACPTTYPAGRVYYGGTLDTRACTCGCEAPTGVTCGPTTVTGYDRAGAVCEGTSKPVSTACSGSMGKTSAVLYEGGVATGGRCIPTGGGTGIAEPVRPTTVCCRR